MRVPTLLALALLAAPLTAGAPDPAAHVPAVLEGYAISPLVALAAPTAIDFGPGGADGPDLYATTVTGSVVRVSLDWTAAGPVARGVSTFAGGFSQPLGLEFDEAGALYVADSHRGAESGRTDGRLTRVAPDGTRTVVVDGLPNGRHNANNLRWGPDGRLYVANGNPNDAGLNGGAVDVFPYSGAILSVDAAEVTASPATLRWRNETGAPIPADDIATHPLNADFAAKVHVLAYGFRNVYDVAFSPAGVAYTGMNGADDPASQDAFYKVQPGADYGFPFCFSVGEPGAVGSGVTVAPNPSYDDAARCAGTPPASALLGWHVCATGLDYPNAPGWGDALYLGECGPFWADSLVPRTLEQPTGATHNTGHKVVRVELDENGDPTRIRDFVTGLALPLDVHFGPDGAMYVADVEMVYRVVPLTSTQDESAPPALGATIVAGPFSQNTGYATRAIALPQGMQLTFASYDVFRHDVVARVDYGPSTQPWCSMYPVDRCPLFWSDTVAFGQTPVLGTENLVPGRAYEYYCTLHPAGMRGTIVALPPI